MQIKRIAVLGGTGFVGTSLCNRLSKEGYALTVLTRNREGKRENIILIPGLDLVETDIHDLEQLTEGLADCDAVINLVGILNERGNKGQGFYHAHVALTEKILEACRKNNIRRILQMSALNADAEKGTSHYLRTKGEAEDLLHWNKDGIKVTSFRPSIIFGHSDNFFNRFANLLKITPVFFPLACYQARFAPVHVIDVVEMMARSINDPVSYGKRFNLCGPKTYTLEELVRYTMKQTGTCRLIIPLGDLLSRLQAAIFDFVPGKPFSTDNYNSTKMDSVCKSNDFSFYHISPVSLESVVPSYLAHQTIRARYQQFRNSSQRI